MGWSKSDPVTGYTPGETPEMWSQVTRETLEYVRDNTTNPARRRLAVAELARRGGE